MKNPITITLSLEEWREVIAGLTGQSFNGREQATQLNDKISTIVAENCEKVPCLRCKKKIYKCTICCDWCGACQPEILASRNMSHEKTNSN